jgi:signal transduction histidine kinase
MQRKLMDASRRAGMADVATTVLHNVGNVLNSVNVSASLVMDAVQQSRTAGLLKAAELLRSHQHDIDRFLTADEKGRRLPAYICSVADAAAHERASIVKELASLQKNIDHIKIIVGRQQAQARVAIGVVERLQVAELLDDALKLNSASYEKRGITLVRDYHDMPDMPVVRLDRHKLFQVVMNLLSNARQAISATDADKRVTVRLRRKGEQRFTIEVADTGCGIPAENLAKIFTFGFTTKTEGHGFGLHASACAAAEMGGSLVARSDGPGRGARFIIELPCEPPDGYTGASSTDLPAIRALMMG